MTDRLNDLFARHLARRLTAQEKVELMGLWLEPSLQPELKRLIDSAWETAGEEEGLTDEELKVLFQELFDKPAEQPKLVRMGGWKRWAAAASIVAILGTGSYFLFFHKTGGQPAPVAEQAKDVKAPQTNRAMVTLANGDKVYLDSAGEGQLASQGSVKLVKLADGKISYEPVVNSSEPGPMIYNTLTNPRGSKVIDMTLSDGSHVWLNAGSSVTYPVSFTGKVRDVRITGEAYFEVAHDAGKPFEVSKEDMHVTVLGTHFNVNAFDDEPVIKVTLLEGSVMVGNGEMRKELKPGQQAQLVPLASSGEIKVLTEANIEEVMAWKEGYFHFEQADLRTILREFSRWYDVEVKYEGTVTDRKFFGVVKRSNSLQKVLEMLQDNNIVYRVEGEKLIVK
jgi:transmembrane sensor